MRNAQEARASSFGFLGSSSISSDDRTKFNARCWTLAVLAFEFPAALRRVHPSP